MIVSCKFSFFVLQLLNVAENNKINSYMMNSVNDELINTICRSKKEKADS